MRRALALFAFLGGLSAARADTFYPMVMAVTPVAVQAGQQGQMLYVVKPNNTAEMRVVTLGRTFGTRVIIEKGVAPGETVVTDGQLRLFPGAPVHIVDAVKLGGAEANPPGSGKS